MAQKMIKRKNSTKSRTFSGRGLAEKVALVSRKAKQADIPTVTPGDTVKVHFRIKEGDKQRIQIFEGVVVGILNRDGARSYTVRKMSHGTGVERVFLSTSPKVAKVEVVQRGRVRRAKLGYLRALEGRKARIDRDIRGAEKIAAADAKAAAKAQA